jgi:hypothetical protein
MPKQRCRHVFDNTYNELFDSLRCLLCLPNKQAIEVEKRSRKAPKTTSTWLEDTATLQADYTGKRLVASVDFHVRDILLCIM